jgi:hypothetical protein
LDGKPVDKSGQSYVLLRFKEPGEKNIDITFVNSNFPKQHFVVDVQDKSAYGYRMGKTDENRFYLIDIVNEGKLIESNSKVDLALSSPSNVIAMYRERSTEVNEVNELPTPRMRDTVMGFLKRRRSKERASKSTSASDSSIKVLNTRIDEKDAGKIVTKTESAIMTPPSKEDKIVTPVPAEVGVKKVRISGNKDCVSSATETEVNSLIDKIATKSDDEDKLIVIKKRVLAGCYNSNQVYELAEKFNTLYGILSLVKFVLPLTSDPQNLTKIESLLKFETNRARLIKLLER